MSKTFTQEQFDQKLEVSLNKEITKAVKAETTRILNIIKDAGVSNKEVESKEVKTHVANVLKELVAEIKAAA